VELTLLDLTSVEQIAALRRTPLDDPALDRQLLRNEKLVAAMSGNNPALARGGARRRGSVTAVANAGGHRITQRESGQAA
jgi:hypothetical protein